jgi:ABC-type sugar transport system permease subunit
MLVKEVATSRRFTAQRGSKLHRKIALAGFLFVLPASLYIFIFNVIPLIYAFYLSLTSYDPLDRGGPKWHGLEGYGEVLGSDQFWSALRITAQYTFEIIPLAIIFALGLALLANRRIPGIGLLRGIFYLPRIVSLTAVSLIWLWLYSRDGLFNYIGTFFGGGDTPWLTAPDLAIHSLVIMRVWKALGGNMVLFLAGLQNIPVELYEAARIDGANGWNLFRYITMPGLRPVAIYVITTNIIYLFQSFSEIYVLTNGGPLESTMTVNMLIYREAFQYNQMGQACVIAFLLFAVIFAFAYVNLRLMSGRGGKR